MPPGNPAILKGPVALRLRIAPGLLFAGVISCKLKTHFNLQQLKKFHHQGFPDFELRKTLAVSVFLRAS